MERAPSHGILQREAEMRISVKLADLIGAELHKIPMVSGAG